MRAQAFISSRFLNSDTLDVEAFIIEDVAREMATERDRWVASEEIRLVEGTSDGKAPAGFLI